MPIQFPANPTQGNVYTYLGTVWTFNGNSWTRTPSTIEYTPNLVSDKLNTSTGFFSLPSGNVAQRPASPANGYTRYNTTLATVEYYNATANSWVSVSGTATATSLDVEYLVVAGGGGGGEWGGDYPR